jgi:endonuclease YncB( thermonuclease family)
MKRLGLALVWAFVVSPLLAQGWEKLTRCEYHQGSHSDGDSIEILRDGKRYIFRLYFVDCVETNRDSRARRAVQSRYFGLDGRAQASALRVAYLASTFTRSQLREPFTIYTRWQPVDADSGNPAIRAFVETAKGDDLATLLVGEGLAIIRHGAKAVSHHPDGRSATEFSAHLTTVERQAREKKRGAWGIASSKVDEPVAAVVEAGDQETLVANAGQHLKVRGRVARVGRLSGRMTFINFSGNPDRNGFVGIVREKFLHRFSERFPNGLQAGLIGKSVVLEGTVTMFRNTPQIDLEHPWQLQVESGP